MRGSPNATALHFDRESMNGCQFVAKLTHACERVVEYCCNLAAESNEGLYFAILNRKIGCVSREFFAGGLPV